MIIRKLFKAETAHRVALAYTTRCQGLHGHSYLFEIFLHGVSQDNAQMLMDFKLLKEKLNSLLMWDLDHELIEMAPKLTSRYVILPYNPTAEQMARHIYYHAKAMALPLQQVIVHETKTGYAQFSGDDDIKIDLSKVIFSEELQLTFNEN